MMADYGRAFARAILTANKRHRAMIGFKQSATATSGENSQKIAFAKVKRLVTSTVLFSGLSLATTVANSAIINLDFATYANGSYYNGVSSNKFIISDYKMTLDTASFVNTVYTDAYNNNPNSTETVNTTLTDGSVAQPGYQPVYSKDSASINQTYANNEMSVGGSFSTNFSTNQAITNNYTGNLPPALIPNGSNQATIFKQGSTTLSWNDIIGSSPKFTVYDDVKLTNLFESMIGHTFSFNQYSNSYSCQVDPNYGWCSGPQTGNINSGTYGNAVLSAVTVAQASLTAVPVPAAVWLFASGLGLLSFSRRKNQKS